MNKHKKRLIGLLIFQVVFTIFHKYYESFYTHEDFYHYSNWTYYVGMLSGTFLMGYAYFLSCSHCGAKQVVRGWSIFDFRWPEDHCYKCGERID